MQPRRIAALVKEAAEDKKAESPIVLDIGKLTSIAHFFVVTHGNSEPHVRAIAYNIIDTCKSKKVSLLHSEGLDSAKWILLDFGSVVAHIFYKDLREFYGLERLWGEAKQF